MILEGETSLVVHEPSQDNTGWHVRQPGKREIMQENEQRTRRRKNSINSNTGKICK